MFGNLIYAVRQFGFFREWTGSDSVVLLTKLKNNVKTELTLIFCGNHPEPSFVTCRQYIGSEQTHFGVISDVDYGELYQMMKNRT